MNEKNLNTTAAVASTRVRGEQAAKAAGNSAALAAVAMEAEAAARAKPVKIAKKRRLADGEQEAAQRDDEAVDSQEVADDNAGQDVVQYAQASKGTQVDALTPAQVAAIGADLSNLSPAAIANGWSETGMVIAA